MKQLDDAIDPDVIAALATCADLGRAQKRLIAHPASALVVGLTRGTHGTIIGIALSGTPSTTAALQQIARELELLDPLYALTARPTSRA